MFIVKKTCSILIAAIVISMFASVTAFAAPVGVTLPNGDMVFSLGGGSSSSTAAQPSAPVSNGGGTSPTGEQYLTHEELIQLGKDMAAEYGLAWHDGPKKTFDMSVSASHTESSWKEFYNISYKQYVEAGCDSVYIVVFHDGNDYQLRIYR